MGIKGDLGIRWCWRCAYDCPKNLKPVTISKCEDITTHDYVWCTSNNSDEKMLKGLLISHK
eukprot:14064529-Ditylum_brightwellii.AAC.1